jgi:hypothetical protein
MAKSKHNVLPLVLLLLFVTVLAVVGYVVYTIVQDVGKNTREKMEKKHMVFTKDGMKVQVKEVKDEAYKDRTQRFVPSCLLLCWRRLTWAVSLSICGTTLLSPRTRVGCGI